VLLKVLGFAESMPEGCAAPTWSSGKAGPGTIAEAACCGAPLLLTSHLPGQERGNARLVAEAGASPATGSRCLSSRAAGRK
jgi:1,2-diacylglycerol 3-beta-galactosyltransferase